MSGSRALGWQAITHVWLPFLAVHGWNNSLTVFLYCASRRSSIYIHAEETTSCDRVKMIAHHPTATSCHLEVYVKSCQESVQNRWMRCSFFFFFSVLDLPGMVVQKVPFCTLLFFHFFIDDFVPHLTKRNMGVGSDIAQFRWNWIPLRKPWIESYPC